MRWNILSTKRPMVTIPEGALELTPEDLKQIAGGHNPWCKEHGHKKHHHKHHSSHSK